MPRYFVADTETTGLGPQAKAVEMAWAEIDENLNVLQIVHTLIDPEIPICPGASGVHGITNADVEDSPTLEEFIDVVLGGPITDEVIFIAHNVVFDKPYFKPVMPNMIGDACTLRLARRFFPDAPNHKLQTLKFHLGLKSGDAHRADGDVVTCLDLLSKIVEKSDLTLDELAHMNSQPQIVSHMPFGKYRGQAIASIPKDYITWLRKQQDLDGDLRYTLDQVAREW